jgi:hypothetical protein
MKRIRALLALALLVGTDGLLCAIPLTVLIEQESEKIADSIRAFNKECAGVDDASPRYTECFNKRGDIGKELSGFVMLVQQEANFLGEPAKERARLQEQQANLPVRIWPINEKDREEKIAQFAKNPKRSLAMPKRSPKS